MKVQYDGFISSIQFILAITFTFPVFYVLQTVLICSLLGVPWWVDMIFFVCQYPLGKWAFKWYSEAKRLKAKVRYRKLVKINSKDLLNTQNIRKKIIQLIIN